MNVEFNLERRLANERPDLENNFKSVIFVMNGILDKTVSLFPDFTDHTIRHSLIVLERANQIIGPDQIAGMNISEIYILICAAYMHDFGMTISLNDYNEMKEGIVPKDYEAEHPDYEIKDIVRAFHNYFSEKLIYKYADIFEFPSKEYMYCIAKVSKGHRKTDLYDETEYDPAYRLPDGDIVRIPYLAALLRLCDEIDITVERNTMASYIEHADTLSYKQHFAIKKLIIGRDRYMIKIETDEDEILDACDKVIRKLNDTLKYCIGVTKARTDFEIRQKSIEVYTDDVSWDEAISHEYGPVTG